MVKIISIVLLGFILIFLTGCSNNLPSNYLVYPSNVQEINDANAKIIQLNKQTNPNYVAPVQTIIPNSSPEIIPDNITSITPTPIIDTSCTSDACVFNGLCNDGYVNATWNQSDVYSSYYIIKDDNCKASIKILSYSMDMEKQRQQLVSQLGDSQLSQNVINNVLNYVKGLQDQVVGKEMICQFDSETIKQLKKDVINDLLLQEKYCTGNLVDYNKELYKKMQEAAPK